MAKWASIKTSTKVRGTCLRRKFMAEKLLFKKILPKMSVFDQK